METQAINNNVAKVKRGDFSKDFIFGTASSAYQYEGAVKEDGRGPSIWDTFTQRTPGKVKDGANGNMAVDSYHLYKEDVKILKKLGMDAYRFSISWSRVLPGIEPYVTLFHWDLPQALEDAYGGFLSSQIVDDFRDYAELCFWEFGDRVKNWITLNEPWTFSVGGYVMGTFAPGRGASSSENASGTLAPSRCSPWHKQGCSNGNPGTEPYLVTHHQLLAHAATVELYKQKFQTSQAGKIGISLVSQWMEPLDVNNVLDIKAALRALDFMFGWFMEPLTTGDYPESMKKLVGSRLPKFSVEQSEKLKGSYDFLGLNYYTATYVTDGPKSNPENLSYTTDSEITYKTERDGKPIGPKGGSDWLYIYPEGIYKLLVHIKKMYNDPLIYITENGVDEENDPNLKLEEARIDKMRIEYHQDHLFNIKKATDEGVNVKGYFVWSFLDNFEWSEGYSVRFGIIHIDYSNKFARYPKMSAIWLMNFLKKGYRKLPAKRVIEGTNKYDLIKRARN
ncbi:hypothetical protein LguiA_019167 [Lonicera macranthoides]